MSARAFLACPNNVPDPMLFAHMAKVVDTLSDAIVRGRRVIVHGDYDADGITATALMVLGLRELGLNPEWYLPNRFTQGYGLSRSAVDTIAEGGPGLLITVDCGVNYPEEVAWARESGMDVIVIDHHQPGPILPNCLLVHPAVGTYPSNDLCGVGLAFKVIHAMHSHLRGSSALAVPEELHKYLDLVAIGTIADLAPLLSENRYYVKEGLKLIAIGARTGLRALAKVAGCTGSVDSGAVAFRLAPRLNAAGRLADASPPLELLLTEDESRASEISAMLHEMNGERQDVERRIFEDATAIVEGMAELPPVLVLSGRDWHEGVVGIVASRLVERYNRPAILLSMRDAIAKGSGRSIAGYDLFDGLNACAEWLTVYGGHAMAVGLTMDECAVESFRAAIERHAARVLMPSDLVPLYRADGILRGEDLNSDTALALASLGPFGSGNPRPRLLILDAEISEAEATRMGGHLRCRAKIEGVGIRAIGFGMADSLPGLQADGKSRVLGGYLRLDEWQGKLKPEFVVESISDTEAAGNKSSGCSPACPWRDALDPETGDGGHSTNGSDCHPDDCLDADEPGLGQGDSGYRPAVGPLHLPSARDLRDNGARTAALAQVLATGEPALFLVCSVSHALADLSGRIPLTGLAGGEIDCMGNSCWGTGPSRTEGRRLVVAEWDAVIRVPAVGASKKHAVVLDPPYRPEHAALLTQLAREGVMIHFLYGDAERKRTATLLKYLVHPRFAMVCVYRALLRGAKGSEVRKTAAELAWREGKVVLSDDDLERAHTVLSQLGLERPTGGTARIEASIAPLYADAEAEYEECSRLCRIL